MHCIQRSEIVTDMIYHDLRSQRKVLVELKKELKGVDHTGNYLMAPYLKETPKPASEVKAEEEDSEEQVQGETDDDEEVEDAEPHDCEGAQLFWKEVERLQAGITAVKDDLRNAIRQRLLPSADVVVGDGPAADLSRGLLKTDLHQVAGSNDPRKTKDFHRLWRRSKRRWLWHDITCSTWRMKLTRLRKKCNHRKINIERLATRITAIEKHLGINHFPDEPISDSSAIDWISF